MAEEPQPNLNTVTNTILLDGLQNPGNRTVWQQFVDRYRPMIVRYAGRFGLGEADAQDAAQQAILAFCTAYQDGKYDREKGRLRVWLFGIARNQIRNTMKKMKRREVQAIGDSDETDFFHRVADDDELERVWEEEWRNAVLRQCLQEVQREFDPKTVTAFEQFAWKGRSAKEVAENLEISPNAVFIAKHRVMKRIRELLPQMEDAF